MITFDVLTLKAFFNEQYDFIKGSRINKIQQPTRREFVFILRNNSSSKSVYINIDPQFYHICISSADNLKKKYVTNPKQPPMFCMLLRKYLENSKIAEVKLVENERILEFYIEAYNELGEKVFLCLAVEFMGKHSNVILYNTDTNIILGCAHNIGAEKSREREIYGGIPYIYPKKQLKSDIVEYLGEIDYDSLADDFYMFSKFFAKLCRGKKLERLKSFVSLEDISPAISENYQEYSLYSVLLGETVIPFSSVSDMIDEYYSYHIGQFRLKTQKNKLYYDVSRRLKKCMTSLYLMQNKINSASDCEKYRHYGDLLMANLYNLRDYSESVDVYDYISDCNITILLDKNKTLKENANYFYKLYNKSKTAKLKLDELMDSQMMQKKYLEQVLYSIENATTMDDLYEIESEIADKNSKSSKNIASEIKCITLANETRIYIGKNNRQNDYIISKLASDEDLWFHVHNNAGSHVLLKTQKISDDLILQCCHLAKENSSVKNSSKIGVIYTKRKYLRKPPGANLGYVTYRNEKEIILD